MKRIFVYEHCSAGEPAQADEALLAAGAAMRDAVVADLLRAGNCAVSVAVGPHSPAVPMPAASVPRPTGCDAQTFVAAQARLHDHVWLIAPETDGVLEQLQRAAGTLGAGRALGCEPAAIALCASKRATLARAAAHDILTPLAFATSPATRRWIVKPDDGAGALATRVHNVLSSARDDLAERRQRGESAVLEAWVAGEALSLSLLCGADGTELLSVNRQQLHIDALGMLSFLGVQPAALPCDEARGQALAAWARRVAGAFPGLRGYVGVDLVWHPRQGPVLVEINPRVTMACVGLSAALGRNVAAAVLAAHDREPLRAAA